VIVPTKGVDPKQALLTVGGEIVDVLEEPMTVSRLWTEVRDRRSTGGDAAIGFDWFILALDLVRTLGIVDLGSDGFLVRSVL